MSIEPVGMSYLLLYTGVIFIYLQRSMYMMKTITFSVGMCGIDFLKFLIGFGSFFKTGIRFGMSLFRFGSKNAVRLGYYSYLLLMYGNSKYYSDSG